MGALLKKIKKLNNYLKMNLQLNKIFCLTIHDYYYLFILRQNENVKKSNQVET